MTNQQLEYARQAVRNITGLTDISCNDSIYSVVFNELSRKEEIEDSTRDMYGRWDHTFSRSHKEDLLLTPRVDEVVISLLDGSQQNGKRQPLWPYKKPFALCLTHDVDVVSRQSHLFKAGRRLAKAFTGTGSKKSSFLASAGSIYRCLTETGKHDSLGHYEDWLKIEDLYGFKSTFFFTVPKYGRLHNCDPDYHLTDFITYRGQKMPTSQMMIEIDAAGWEIGVHGTMESAHVPGMLAKQKLVIEKILGHEVKCTRQHYLNYDMTITPSLQNQAGLVCDSTVGYARSLGFRAGTSFPYWCWDWINNCPLPLLEIPLVIMDTPLLGLPVDSIIQQSIALMDKVEHVGGCLTLNWHPNYINDPIYEVYLALLKEAAQRGAWGCTAGDIYGWWIEREQHLKGNI